MSRVILASATSLCLTAFLADRPSAQQLDPKTIDQTITMGKANTFKDLVWECTAKRVGGAAAAFGVAGAIGQSVANSGKATYRVTMMGARGRVSIAAFERGLAGEPFAAADIPTDWFAPMVFVLVQPTLPDPKSAESPVLPRPISAAVFRENPGKKELLKPTGAPATTARTWRNAAGASVDYTETWFRFDAAAFADLYSPTEVQFVLSTDDGERTCGYVPLRTVRNLTRAR